MDDIEERLRDWLKMTPVACIEAADEIARLRTQCGGNCRYWEGRWRDERAENERLTRRLYEVDAQLIAEDHIHARECMALRAEKDAENERLRTALQALVADIEEYESINNLAPNPGKQDCWQSVTRAKAILRHLGAG